MKIGIDLGSRKVKFALVSGGAVKRLETFDTISFYRNFGRMKGDDLTFDLAATGLFSPDEIAEASIIATGYGRNTLHLKGVRVISEIRAHTAGAVFQTGFRDFTLLDMGGQDTKVALIRDGMLRDFVMNDKCAASSGRYLENMAAVLEVGLDELSSHWENPVRLDATCGIFGESELIGQIVRGAFPWPGLCAGGQPDARETGGSHVAALSVRNDCPDRRRCPQSCAGQAPGGGGACGYPCRKIPSTMVP